MIDAAIALLLRVLRWLGGFVPLRRSLRRLRLQLAVRRLDAAAIRVGGTRSAPCVLIGSLAEYEAYERTMATELEARRAVEVELQSAHQSLLLKGVDSFEGGNAWYLLDMHPKAALPDGRVNFRENLSDLKSGLNCRIRASLLSLYSLAPPAALGRKQIYVTEQTTPLYRYLRARFPHVIGSEYLGDAKTPGTTYSGIRHEDLTRLSFPDRALDVVIALEILEHLSDHRHALFEMARVLRAGGLALITTPFDCNRQRHLVRAVCEPDGRITHQLPPEYHGDPLDPGGGILSFRVFGWELFDELRAAGFRSVGGLLSWDLDAAILGDNVFVVYAWK